MPRKPKETKVPKQSQQVGNWPALKLTEKWWFNGDPYGSDIVTRAYADQTIPDKFELLENYHPDPEMNKRIRSLNEESYRATYEGAVKYLDEVYPHFADFVDLYRKAKLMPAPIELPPQKSNPDNDLRLSTFVKRYRDHEQREAFMIKSRDLKIAIQDITYKSNPLDFATRCFLSTLDIWDKFMYDKLFPTHPSEVLRGLDSGTTKEDRANLSNEQLAFFCHAMFMKPLYGDSAPIKRFRVRLVFD